MSIEYWKINDANAYYYIFTDDEDISLDIYNLYQRSPTIYSKDENITGYQYLIDSEIIMNKIIKKYHPILIDGEIEFLSKEDLAYNKRIYKENEEYWKKIKKSENK